MILLLQLNPEVRPFAPGLAALNQEKTIGIMTRTMIRKKRKTPKSMDRTKMNRQRQKEQNS